MLAPRRRGDDVQRLGRPSNGAEPAETRKSGLGRRLVGRRSGGLPERLSLDRRAPGLVPLPHLAVTGESSRGNLEVHERDEDGWIVVELAPLVAFRPGIGQGLDDQALGHPGLPVRMIEVGMMHYHGLTAVPCDSLEAAFEVDPEPSAA
jgi:hypothetical protein